MLHYGFLVPYISQVDRKSIVVKIGQTFGRVTESYAKLGVSHILKQFSVFARIKIPETANTWLRNGYCILHAEISRLTFAKASILQENGLLPYQCSSNVYRKNSSSDYVVDIYILWHPINVFPQFYLIQDSGKVSIN
ncbi:unnamed protein product [Sphenostylis stenocarpa]|uniref:Uncharacterized protein n=1 Tax=Sphenostylis stenocarpa TaxID=92480 RepID=A0AA86VDX1_9FABA|nr:unnamed protein product [Sphenostylis stenocarpa]